MVQLTDRTPPDGSAQPTLGDLLRPLVAPVLASLAMLALLALWIRAEPVEISRALQVGLGAVPFALFGAVVWLVHRADE
jgi:hypothetical protein